MASSPHSDFARRLQQALDYSGFAQGRKRTAALADQYAVTRETARKWLLGLSLPELERMLQLAVQQEVSFEWLATGRGHMQGRGLSVQEHPSRYADQEELRLIGLMRKMPRKKRRALIQLLEDDA